MYAVLIHNTVIKLICAYLFLFSLNFRIRSIYSTAIRFGSREKLKNLQIDNGEDTPEMIRAIEMNENAIQTFTTGRYKGSVPLLTFNLQWKFNCKSKKLVSSACHLAPSKETGVDREGSWLEVMFFVVATATYTGWEGGGQMWTSACVKYPDDAPRWQVKGSSWWFNLHLSRDNSGCSQQHCMGISCSKTGSRFWLF